VTSIAAYAEPCRVFCLMMMPALDHGSRPGCWPDRGPWPARTLPPGDSSGSSPVSEVIRAVMLPSLASGWCTK
jgi:hypothetical protein